MKYTPNPPAVVEDMLHSLGLNTIDGLYTDIPEELKINGLNLPSGLSEIELRKEIKRLAGENLSTEDYPCFLGAGAYDHYIPAALTELLGRSEFYTAYTPYQPEISQGILQSIFEYQTLICRLTGMDVVNASMYDGASALAEAAKLAALSTKREKILVPDTVHPEYLQVLKTYSLSGAMEIVVVPGKNGVADTEAMVAQIDKSVAGVIIQQPNFYGNLEAPEEIVQAVHSNKGLFVMCADPISMAIFKTPAKWGADIVVGEGQPLGNSLNFGGPYLGFFASTSKLLRRIPGRIVGQTADEDGKRAFVLTLQAREQHIRREKALSNICSNQALCALAATIYLTLVGPEGLKEIAVRSHQLAVYAQNQLEKAGFALKYQAPYFREFAIKLDDPAGANKRLLENGIIGGYELEDGMLLAFTEKRTKEEIDKLVAVLGGEKHE
ncbi:MAG: aminomethyl-transferring glycine dehydrogenase subunit GcvPA [Syntrophomonadaceae bacterium]|nr:aminomethyl-transferring glycine dehydrogenase subunit GcvPA [Syntrophomonadaceae bacterium]MDD4550341.1 aminomethyl-transferring glycine dehydrogenase subunit GcvPA [Syntrophomonadaceae bacterium]